ncbi:GspE/PulE family protein [Paludibacterium yongneupense]|uniref:GspE/PulE family protein n=1 Tax=Paludibacterium yongneupense TaxID=400061 RepID=UPI000424327E|nr:ATPase, T2SS/T4P/T4SS family [Paludibacterium yongneupense]
MEAPAVRFLRQVVQQAVERQASDLHLEPLADGYRVRCRIDGVLHPLPAPAASLAVGVITRVKVLAGLDIAERRIPQDGRMRLSRGDGQVLDVRVSTLPTLYGESVALRLQGTSSEMLDVSRLGLEPAQRDTLLAAIRRRSGLVLVTGPTGSGKTVTLYSLLQVLNAPERKIATVEDPVEIPLPGVAQVAVNDKAGLSFAVALRAFLRQDPDVMMVGEIRDLETADIAIKAAHTGHLVLATLHTRDAPGSLARLLDMGVAPFSLVGTLSLVVAQRLLRRLCPHCRRREMPPSGVGGGTFIAVGCSLCHGTGYCGRVGVFELMPMSWNLGRLVMSGSAVDELAAQARREGMLDLADAAREKVRQGVTSQAEAMAAL